MRLPAAALALATLAALVGCAWIAGCNDLSSDCELNLNCASSNPPPNPPQCADLLMPGACDACMQASCCQELDDCAANNTCLNGCFYNVLPSPPECAAAPAAGFLSALSTCMTQSCAADCAPKDQCNPVTNNGCMPNGSACDLVYGGMFVCLPPGGPPVPICQGCDNLFGPFCGPGLHCVPGLNMCARFCCTDADCGAGRCELDPMKAFAASPSIPGDSVGVCLSMDPMTPGPACDAPAASPSVGACFMGFAGM